MKKIARSAVSIVFILTFALITTAYGQQDETITVKTGEEVKFAATCTSALPVTYEWFKDGKPMGIKGDKYVIPAATILDEGVYHIVATNDNGSTHSNKVTFKLIVLPPQEAFDTYEVLSGEVVAMLNALRKDVALASLPKYLKYGKS